MSAETSASLQGGVFFPSPWITLLLGLTTWCGGSNAVTCEASSQAIDIHPLRALCTMARSPLVSRRQQSSGGEPRTPRPSLGRGPSWTFQPSPPLPAKHRLESDAHGTPTCQWGWDTLAQSLHVCERDHAVGVWPGGQEQVSSEWMCPSVLSLPPPILRTDWSALGRRGGKVLIPPVRTQCQHCTWHQMFELSMNRTKPQHLL